MPDHLAPAASTTATCPVRKLSKTQEHIKEVIEKRLADGTYKPGTTLPSLQLLGRELSVSTTTVRRALQPFRETGALQAVYGRGHVVTDPTATTPVTTSADEIEKAIRARLHNGTYAVGTWLPSQPELAAQFAVTTPTIHRVLSRLKGERLVIPVASLGTYVADPNQPDAAPPSTPPVNTRALRTTLRTRLHDGTYPPGTQLPSLDDLCTEFGVGPHTVTTALTHLHTRGHLNTGPDGSQFFAKPAKPRLGKPSAT